MFTMKGSFVISVGKEGERRLQFYHPSGIAVHPSGRVFVADTGNHRIQVLNPDLSYLNMFGNKGSAPGQFSSPRNLAIDSSGVVYVADYGNDHVQLFSTDGHFMSTFGSYGILHGHLDHPTSVCVDSTNYIVYITDSNNRVSVYTTSGRFIKCFGNFVLPEGVAVDNTTRALYVCDFNNDCVVVYILAISFSTSCLKLKLFLSDERACIVTSMHMHCKCDFTVLECCYSIGQPKKEKLAIHYSTVKYTCTNILTEIRWWHDMHLVGKLTYFLVPTMQLLQPLS